MQAASLVDDKIINISILQVALTNTLHTIVAVIQLHKTLQLCVVLKLHN